MLSNEDVMQGHDVLYDSPNPRIREPVDLATYPLYEEGSDPQTENSVYGENGRKVPRRLARLSRNTIPNGLLINFANVNDMFDQTDPAMGRSHEVYLDPDHDDPMEGVTAPTTSSYHLFPQANLRMYGHVQANDVIRPFKATLEEIHRSLAISELDDEDGGPLELANPVIQALGFQAYNELSHRVRATAAEHDTQQGEITSAMTGFYAMTGTTKDKHKSLMARLTRALPHRRHAEKIKLPTSPRKLRVEILTLVDFDSIRPENRNGRSESF